MNVLALAVTLPLLTALVGPFFGRRHRARRGLVGVSALAQFALHLGVAGHVLATGPMVLPAGGWPAPLGITLMADALAAALLVLTSLVILVALAHGFASTPAAREHPLRLPLVQFLAAGVNLAFLTADLFNLFVALEVVLISSYALLTFEADHRTVRATLPYVAVNIFGGIVFLAATGLAYAVFGTLNFADLAQRAAALAPDPRLTAWALLMLVALGLKTALVPLFFWLPNSYPVLPASLGAIFAGTLTKIGAYGLIRVFTLIVPPETPAVFPTIQVLAVVTILVGALGALARRSPRHVFAFLIIGQMGFVALALGLATERAVNAGVFHLLQEIPVAASLFLFAASAAVRRAGARAEPRAVAAGAPWFAAAFFCQALALAGVPPLSGFWGKFGIVASATTAGAPLLIAGALTGSVLMLVALLRLWLRDFWSPPSRHAASAAAGDQPPRRPVTWSAGVLTLGSLALGLGVAGSWRVAQAATASLLDRDAYIRLILSAPAGEEVARP
jgi:multicomponent Na+:H+ antiporter subunit D